MANDNQIPLELTVDSKDAEKGLKDFEKTAGKSVDSVEQAFSSLKTIAVAAVAAFAGAKLIGALKDMVSEAAEADQAVRNLGSALALTGEFSDEALNSLTDYAAGLQKTTTNTDEAILNALTLAKSFGITNDEAQKLVTVATDLAAATGKDLNTAVQELGGTFSGSIGRLGKLAPELKNLSEESVKAGAVLDVLGNKLEGFAQSSAKTFGGSLKITQNAFGEIFESLGKVITQNPVVIATIQALGKAFQGIGEFIDQNKDSLNDFVSRGLKAVVASIPKVLDGVTLLISIFQVVIEVVSNTVRAFLALGTILFEISKPVRDFANIIGNALIGGISKFIAQILNLAKVIPGVSSALGGLGLNLDSLQKTVDEFANGSIDDALKLDTSVSDSYQKFVLDAAKDLDNLVSSAEETSKNFLDSVGTGSAKVAEYARTATTEILKVDNASKKVTDGLEKQNKALAKVIDNSKELERIKGSYEKVKGAIEGVQQEIDKQTLSAKQLLDAENKRSETLIKNALREIEIDNKLSTSQKQIAKEQIELFDKLIKKKNEIANDKLKIADFTISEFVDEFSKGFENLKNTLSDISVDPSSIFDLADSFLSRVAKGFKELKFGDVAAAIGKGIDFALSGKEGVVGALQAAGGAFASTFGEQFGPIASSVIGKLAAGPEQTKQFIKDFFDALPDVIIAIVEALGEVLPTLIEKIFSAEFLARLGFAIAKSFLSTITLGLTTNSIGKKWGIEFSNAVKSTFAGGAAQMGVSIREAFTNGTYQLYQSIINAFAYAGSLLFSGLATAFQNFFAGIGPAFAQAGAQLYQGILAAFQGGGASVFQSITDAGNNVASAFTKPVDRLIEFLNNFSFPEIGGNISSGISGFASKIPGGGAVGGFVRGLSGGGGGIFASGGVVPSGFPNDSFPARLTSEEMVLPPAIANGLTNLINNGGSTDSGSSDTLVATLLSQILQKLSEPVSVSTTAQVNGRALADIMLELSRNNARTAV